MDSDTRITVRRTVAHRLEQHPYKVLVVCSIHTCPTSLREQEIA